jgi:hypothetical protein
MTLRCVRANPKGFGTSARPAAYATQRKKEKERKRGRDRNREEKRKKRGQKKTCRSGTLI